MIERKNRTISLFLFCTAFLATVQTQTQALAADLMVNAAISLEEPFTEIGHDFEKNHPGDHVIYNFGASGTLATQIKQGAPVDVFASASSDQIDQLARSGLIDKLSSKIFAGNNLVLVVPLKGKTISTIDQLGNIKRLATGDPQTVPAGKYAREALKNAAILEKLEKNQAFIFGENVRQVLTYVERGDVDAGIVYSSEAKNDKNVRATLDLTGKLTNTIVYPIAVIKESKNQTLAGEYIRFILQKKQQSILQKYGFTQAHD